MLEFNKFYSFGMVIKKNGSWVLCENQRSARSGGNHLAYWGVFANSSWESDNPQPEVCWYPAAANKFSLLLSDAPTNLRELTLPYSVTANGIVYDCWWPTINSGITNVKIIGTSEHKHYNLFDLFVKFELGRSPDNKLSPCFSLYTRDSKIVAYLQALKLTGE